MDEAERCHQLAILETGHLRVQGAPTELMNALSSRVVEITGESLRQVKRRLLELAEVESAAQQGLRLRVLLRETQADAVAFLRQRLDGEALDIEPARPSLEDVFVAATVENGNP